MWGWGKVVWVAREALAFCFSLRSSLCFFRSFLPGEGCANLQVGPGEKRDDGVNRHVGAGDSWTRLDGVGWGWMGWVCYPMIVGWEQVGRRAGSHLLRKGSNTELSDESLSSFPSINFLRFLSSICHN